MPANYVDNIGDGKNLRPNPSDGWRCVWASGIIATHSATTQVDIERQGFGYFTFGGNTWPWEQLASPDSVASGIRAKGKTVYYMEVWENPPTLGIVGNDDYIYIAVYG